jgi:predicted nucleic acid-binding protein
MKTLIDTDVLSESRKLLGKSTIKRRFDDLNSDDLFISAITLGEIAYGTSRLPSGSRRSELENWLAGLEKHFGSRILPIDRDIARLWGEITAKASSAGRSLHAADGLIAATAIHHGLRILTGNTKDYEVTGAQLDNPWEE